LAFGVFACNGHNTSQSGTINEGFRMRMAQWARGCELEKPSKRFFPWLFGRQKKFMWRRIRQWLKTGMKRIPVMPLDENLAIGWFPVEVPTDPVHQGNSFVMHALGPECGGLWACGGSSVFRTVHGHQNVQTYYIVVLREKGAAYYAASLPGVPDVGAYPGMRLLAVDAFATDPTVYAGVHQSVLGQIGFRVDTRVYRAQVTVLPGFEEWYGSAHGADALLGAGTLASSAAEIGGTWTVHQGSFTKTADGLAAAEPNSLATLQSPSETGLVHVLIKTNANKIGGVSLIWRFKDEGNFWSFEMGTGQCHLAVKENGHWSRFPASKSYALNLNSLNSAQVVDDGENFRLYLNGNLVFGTTFADRRLSDATGVGVAVRDATQDSLFLSFEAHPRSVPIPKALDLGAPWLIEGNKVVASDDFTGPPADLDQRPTSVGAKIWKKEIGFGAFQLTGSGALKVQGTLENPSPGRTAYTIDWSNPNFADVVVSITPPGLRRGLKERGRGGLIFWQDARTYLTLSVFLDDWYGTSIAAFFQVDGFEELYDAVWTNIGRRVHPGIPYDFRVVFDGERFLAFVNGEPVLYRALSDVYPTWDRLQIRQVGMVTNWEWGNDTGTIFKDFIAKDRV
jgi:hypothetical protein